MEILNQVGNYNSFLPTCLPVQLAFPILRFHRGFSRVAVGFSSYDGRELMAEMVGLRIDLHPLHIL